VDACRYELLDLRDVISRDEASTRHDDRDGHGIQIRLMQGQHHDRQISLQILLLVDCKEHVALLDSLEDCISIVCMSESINTQLSLAAVTSHSLQENDGNPEGAS